MPKPRPVLVAPLNVEKAGLKPVVPKVGAAKGVLNELVMGLKNVGVPFQVKAGVKPKGVLNAGVVNGVLKPPKLVNGLKVGVKAPKGL